MTAPTPDLPLNPMKYDSNAVPVQLLPAYPMYGIATAFGYGALKYKENSWRNPEVKPVDVTRTYGSVMRHLMRWSVGEEFDPDSGLPHLWLAGAQLMILIEHSRFSRAGDSRHTHHPDILKMFDSLLEQDEFRKFAERQAELLAKKEQPK